MTNLQTDCTKIEKRYWYHINSIDELKAGTAGASLMTNAEYWIEFSRKEAVKYGNRLFKLCGVYPDRFNEVKK